MQHAGEIMRSDPQLAHHVACGLALVIMDVMLRPGAWVIVHLFDLGGTHPHLPAEW